MEGDGTNERALGAPAGRRAGAAFAGLALGSHRTARVSRLIELDHLNLMVADVARSRAFYEPLLRPFGFPVNRDFGDFAVGLGAGPNAVLALVKTEETVQPIHLAFRVETRAEVHLFYASAIALGAADNGEPGSRPQYHEHYYAAFVRDPDGHNLEVVCHLPPPAA